MSDNVHSVTISKSGRLSGTARVPGDKSISHRAIILGGLAIGRSTVAGLLEGADVMATVRAMRAFGAEVTKQDDGTWQIYGVGPGGLREPDDVLDMGNAGTAARLLIGLAASQPMVSIFTGDASLRRRPMGRVIDPLAQMGAEFTGRDGDRLPLAVRGPEMLQPIRYESPVASAQLKSAILLAGLNAPGRTTVIEPVATRDHTENMMHAFGQDVACEDLDNGARAIHLSGQEELTPCDITVPADPSSAAFPVVAALISEGAEITVPGICMNEHRTGLYTTLQEMGADIEYSNQRTQGGEKLADVHVRGSGPLSGMDVPPARVPAMIDEIPVLAVAAACARGTTRLTNLGELRVKESDRLAGMARGLTACGVAVEEGEDSLVIHGCGGKAIPGGATIETAMDHRIAMSFAVLGTVADAPVTLDDITHIDTSFPGFFDLMRTLGADMREVADA